MSNRDNPTSVRRMALSGLCASLIGIGLSRFAYAPLLPALIAAHWFTPSQAAYLGAANLAGYLGGALLAPAVSARVSAIPVLRTMMLAASAAFFACAFPISFWWVFLWRVLSGVSGGVIMVLVAPTILPHVPASRRGLVAGAVFVGVGGGIIASAPLVPALLRWGLTWTWCGLGALALALSLIAWNGWPGRGLDTAPPSTEHRREAGPLVDCALAALLAEYALNAVGLVAHMVFLVDFVARGLGRGLGAGAQYWVLFGLGAAFGPLITGHIADRIGFRPALRLAFLVQAAAVGVLVLTAGAVALAFSSVIVGAFVPGIVPLVLGRVHELIADPDRRKAAWGLCTTAFAIGLAGAAYGLSWVFVRTGGSYIVLFGIGAAALMLAFVIDTALAMLVRRRDSPGAGVAAH